MVAATGGLVDDLLERAHEIGLEVDGLNGLRAPGDETTGGAVGAVIQGADGLEHAFAGGGQHTGMVVDDARDSLMRYACQAGHIMQSCLFGRMFSHRNPNR